MVKWSPNGRKTLREKEKLFVTSNFSFSPTVFKRSVLQTRKNQGLFEKGLTRYCFEKTFFFSFRFLEKKKKKVFRFNRSDEIVFDIISSN